MNQREKAVLDLCSRFILENLLLTEEFYASLRQRGTLTDGMIDKVKSEKTNQKRISEFITQLKRRGGDAFDSFLTVLRESSQEFIAEKLQSYLVIIEHSPPQYRTVLSELRSLGTEKLIERILCLETACRSRDENYERVLQDFKRASNERDALIKENYKMVQKLEHLSAYTFDLQRQEIRRHSNDLKVDDHEKKIGKENDKITNGEREIKQAKTKLSEVEKQLEEHRRNRVRIVKSLNLDESATDDQIEIAIDRLKTSDAANKTEMEKIESQLKKLKKDVYVLNDKRIAQERSNKALQSELNTLKLQKHGLGGAQDRPPLNRGKMMGPPTTRLPSIKTSYINIEPTQRDTGYQDRGQISRPPTTARDAAISSTPRTFLPLLRKLTSSDVSLTHPNEILPSIGAATETRYCALCRRKFHS